MSAAEVIIGRLDGVQSYGKGYRARCPACGGRGRKLSVSEGDDGRALLHCFGGCEVLAITQAVGLDLADLFPERLRDDTPDGRRKARRAALETQWGAALETIDHEAGVIFSAGRAFTGGAALSAEDVKRLTLAVKRVAHARGILRESEAFRPARVVA